MISYSDIGITPGNSGLQIRSRKIYANMEAAIHCWVERLHRFISDMLPNKQWQHMGEKLRIQYYFSMLLKTLSV
jgi:hypothetical protein